jgi:hypothetical protein
MEQVKVETPTPRGQSGQEIPGYFKVWVRTSDDPKFYTNAMQYATKEWAEDAARDLMSRWMLVREWKVAPVGEVQE